jgi:hypothetical protein
MAAKKKASSVGSAKPEGSATRGLLAILERRFGEHPHRHPGLAWETVVRRLDSSVLTRLAGMEETGGEPDVALIERPGVIVFVDCAVQSPSGRRGLCYDREAWQARKDARPPGNVLDVASSMGIELLDEKAYRALQALEPLDTTTSSWIATPAAIRAAGGALFCDRRYDHVFAYHNGAQSYYAARGFRARLQV